ncbi:Crp/Fnr family transcriptional regulator [Inhella sp.]|uniref:Crp/Fnr family transcriptional regulator n=1 Tax=Inhella sp. TaxID=1921806 RepID=UPI0035B0EACB
MLDTRSFDVQRFLARMPLFQDIGPEALERLSRAVSMRRVDRGEYVFHVGDPCESFYVTVSGQVRLFVIAPNGNEKVIELIGPGMSFAEALMFLDKPCLVNAQSLADTLLMVVPRAAVRQELEADSRFALRMLAGLSRRLHGLVHDVQAYALQSGVQRVVGYLLRDLADGEAQQTVSLPVSKATVASRLSLTPEYFSRVLHELEAAGLIDIDKRDIHILDAAALARYQAA